MDGTPGGTAPRRRAPRRLQSGGQREAGLQHHPGMPVGMRAIAVFSDMFQQGHLSRLDDVRAGGSEQGAQIGTLENRAVRGAIPSCTRDIMARSIAPGAAPMAWPAGATNPSAYLGRPKGPRRSGRARCLAPLADAGMDRRSTPSYDDAHAAFVKLDSSATPWRRRFPSDSPPASAVVLGSPWGDADRPTLQRHRLDLQDRPGGDVLRLPR